MNDDDRIKELQGRLQRAKSDNQNNQLSGKYKLPDDKNALGLAFRVSVEVVSALAVGLGLGLLLDHVFDTRPWIMLVCLVLGACAGILNVYRVAMGFGYKAGYDQPQKPDTVSGDPPNTPPPGSV